MTDLESRDFRDDDDGGDAPAGSRPVLRALAGAVGAGLLVAYLVFERGLPRGPAEFAFWPALEPLPFAAIRGFTYEQLVRWIGRLVLVGPALVALGWALVPIGERLALRLSREETPSPRRLAFALGALGVALAAWFQLGLLEGRALVDDELSYAWQAQLLADGRLTEDRLPRWAPEPFTIWTEHGATGKYLFGEPLVQIPGVLLGTPALAHLPLFALTLFLWFRLVETSTRSQRVAVAATALVAFSPMVLLTTATGLSHASALFAMVAIGWGLVDLRRAIDSGSDTSDGSGIRGALVAGSALGFAFTVRPQVAVSFGFALALFLVVDAWRARRFRALGAFVLAGLPWLVAVLAYDAHLAGSPFTLPWSLYSPIESYGFGAVLEGSDYEHTFLRGIENLAVVAVRLNAFLLGWPLSLGLLVAWWALGRPARGAAPWLVAGAAQTAFHFGYFTPGISGFGALYHYELVLPFAFLGAHAIDRALDRRPLLAATALGVHFLLGTGGFLVEQGTRLDRMADLLHDRPAEILDALEAPGEPSALLLYEAWPSESVHLGWIGSGFPVRERRDDAPVVTYPRSGPTSVAALRRLYADRACWYFRVDPATFRPDLRPCAAAEDLLARPFALEGPRIAIRPTAMTRGLLPPPGG